jgi:hypothetical protein
MVYGLLSSDECLGLSVQGSGLRVKVLGYSVNG